MAFYVNIFINFLFVVCALESADSSNILGFFPSPSRSHYIVHEAYMKGLAAKGHNVTVVTVFPTDKSKKLPPNYNELPLIMDESDHRQMQEMMKDYLKGQEKNEENTFRNMPKFIRMLGRRWHDSIQNEVTQKLMKSGQKFDLFVVGWFFNDFLLGLAGHFQCPSVVIASLPPLKSLRDLVGDPSGIPFSTLFGRSSHGVPSFWQRTLNVLGFALEFVGTEFANYFLHAPYYEMSFPAAKKYPTFDEVKRNVSLVLVSDHFSEGNVRAHMPNMREIAGIQAKNVPNPLPPNLQKYLDEAEHGAILFSLGTNLKSSEFSADRLRALFEAFAKLKQRILWKWDGAVIPPEKSENILMTNWLPQNDILAHPKIRLFISHCGSGGVNEAKFHGVPILGIPVFADQPKNAKAVAEEGWALELPYSHINESSLSSAIAELLTNERYTQKAKELSRLYRDRPQTALEEAVYWTEYVLRHNGARHMQSPAVHLSFIQQSSLDVLAALLLILYIFAKLLKWLTVKIFGCCLRVIRPKKEQVKIKKN